MKWSEGERRRREKGGCARAQLLASILRTEREHAGAKAALESEYAQQLAQVCLRVFVLLCLVCAYVLVRCLGGGDVRASSERACVRVRAQSQIEQAERLNRQLEEQRAAHYLQVCARV